MDDILTDLLYFFNFGLYSRLKKFVWIEENAFLWWHGKQSHYRPGHASMERAFYVISGEPKIRRYTESYTLCTTLTGCDRCDHEWAPLLLSYNYMGQQKPALAWMFLLYAGNVHISLHFFMLQKMVPTKVKTCFGKILAYKESLSVAFWYVW